MSKKLFLIYILFSLLHILFVGDYNTDDFANISLSHNTFAEESEIPTVAPVEYSTSKDVRRNSNFSFHARFYNDYYNHCRILISENYLIRKNNSYSTITKKRILNNSPPMLSLS